MLKCIIQTVTLSNQGACY